MLTVGSLFSGMGALDLAAEEVFGATTAWVSDSRAARHARRVQTGASRMTRSRRTARQAGTAWESAIVDGPTFHEAWGDSGSPDSVLAARINPDQGVLL